MNSFRWPDRRSRTVVVGRNGTGKTRLALWLLANHALDIPWAIIDYKRDEHIAKLPARKRRLGAGLPWRRGLNLYQPGPQDDNAVEKLLWSIYKRENMGVFVDEAHMLPQDTAVRALLTQGRSKTIPMIILTQRPRWVSRFAFSEANYFAMFPLSDPADRKTISALTELDPEGRVPPWHARWYDVANNSQNLLTPAPDPVKSARRIVARLKARS